MELSTIALGLIIFFARIADVSIGTLRFISIIQERIWLSFFLGFIEVFIWVTIFSAVLSSVQDNLILSVFYALGFATGNIVGIRIEKRLAFGNAVVKIFTQKKTKEMPAKIREAGFVVTTFVGEGVRGPVTELFVFCKRKQLSDLISVIVEVEPEVFYTVEKTGSASRVYQSAKTSMSTWKFMGKRK